MKRLRKAIVSYLTTLCYGTISAIFSLSWPTSAFAEAGSSVVKSTPPWSPETYPRDALVGRDLTKQGGQPATPIVMNYLTQQGEHWLNQLGRAKIDLRGGTLRALQGQVALLLPIQHNEQWLWFAQGGWVQSKHRSTLSLGTGQRQFCSKQGYWGNNLFVDYQPQGNHSRLGLGLELGSQAFSSQINGYLPLSDRHGINNSADWANPAQGIDIRLRYQPPQWPHWRLGITGDHYWGTIARSSSLVENPTALTAGVHYTPIPLVTLGYHFRWNLSGKPVNQLSCSLNYRLGTPWEQQVDRQQVIRQSLEVDRLKLVSRHHAMVLQQQPNDEIKLEIKIKSPGEHQPGSTIQVKVRITTPRPLNEWQFSWAGIPVDTQPSIKDFKNIETLTLPNHAGTYTLQLQACHAKGRIAYSNTLQLKVGVEEQDELNLCKETEEKGSELTEENLKKHQEILEIENNKLRAEKLEQCIIEADVLRKVARNLFEKSCKKNNWTEYSKENGETYEKVYRQFNIALKTLNTHRPTPYLLTQARVTINEALLFTGLERLDYTDEIPYIKTKDYYARMRELDDE